MCLNGRRSPLRNSEENLLPVFSWSRSSLGYCDENRVDGSGCISREIGNFPGELMGSTRLRRYEWTLGSKPGGCSAVSEPAVCSGPTHTHPGERLKAGGADP